MGGHRAFIIAVLFLLGLTTTIPATASDAPDYAWPLSYKGCLTSSFAEYRRNHFHAGIDLSTNGKTGFKVHAASDGEVYRLRASPYGYGKAIYLEFPDGKIAVYAHLSDYAPRIREAVDLEQRKRQRYDVDFRLPPGQRIPVSRGEIIGFSGQTGIGAPHLHFELRDGEDTPLNPVKNGFPIRDDVPPEIRSVVLTPLEGTAEVDGSVRAASFPFVWSETDQAYRLEKPVHIKGPIGLMMQTDDQQSACERTLGVYRLDLKVDDQPIYSAQFDKFSYDVAHLVGIEFDQGSIERGGSRYHRLFTSATNLLPFTITDRRGAGVLFAEGTDGTGEGVVLEPGTHEVELTAADANGNEARAIVEVYTGDLPVIRRAQIAGEGEVTVYLDDSPGRLGKVEVARSINGARRWETRQARYVAERGGWLADDFPPTQSDRKPLIFRIEATTLHGVPAKPVYIFRNYDSMPTPEPVMNVGIEYHADAALIVLDVDRAFPYTVEARVAKSDRSVLRPVMDQVAPSQWEGLLSLSDLGSEPAWVTVTIRGSDGAEWSTVQEIRAMRIAAYRGGKVSDNEDRAFLKVPRTALVRDSYFRIEEFDRPPLEEGLTYMSPAFRFEPADALLRDDVEVGIVPFLASEERKRTSIYRLDMHNRWKFMSRPQQAEDATIWSRARILSRYALILDDSVPRIYGVRPAEGVVVGTRNPRLQAKVTDIGSGFGSDDVQIHLDGKKMIAEWDPERSLISYKVRSPLSVGSHKMTIHANDQAGNTTRRETTFFVSGN